MKKFIVNAALFCLTVFLPIFTYSLPLDTPKGSSLSISLPVNATEPEGQKVHLVVEIPKGYKCLQNNFSEMLEFIPENEKDPYKWSEIITTFSLVGKNIKSKDFVKLVAQNIKSNAKQVTILSPISSKDSKKYSTSSCTLSYKANGRKELLYMKFFSGPHDCSGFQYTVVLTDEMTEKKALEKIRKFEKDQVSIVSF